MKQRISCLIGSLALAATLLSGCGAQQSQSAPATDPSGADRPAVSQARQLGLPRVAGAKPQGSLSLSDWWRRAYAKMQAGAAAGGVERALNQQPTAR